MREVRRGSDMMVENEIIPFGYQNLSVIIIINEAMIVAGWPAVLLVLILYL